MIICLGPVCIPLYAVVPVIIAFLVKCRDYIKAWWYGAPAEGEMHCENGVCMLKRPMIDESNPAEEETTESPKASSVSATWKESTKQIEMIHDEDVWEDRLSNSRSQNLALIVKFTASWCGPCKKISPVYKELCASVNAEKNVAKFVEIDVDELDDISAKALVAAMPTFIVYKGGNEVGRLSGAIEDKLRNLVKEHCS
mmetsp:Transcript_1194/g.2879  ORF Transcript_1194/g.2879 Transcript_1194/m.2879 type:complete len:198 (-) Transcript_1194:380-973(-)|eukprot:CAMPEP_0171492834 /NCGR_PEP_ID=MMETSP0958-20121227/4633_1 /TAXON_ID=87120 /ORGANISM="Aurantiochytrium limacinum, Strain ATCCMYA-1381" /LENGTH=197 /DNA_ID=CAMNT_0012026403 /DNA_START=396 /DNA_END=989 /DNA_ORIENTATION=+